MNYIKCVNFFLTNVSFFPETGIFHFSYIVLFESICALAVFRVCFVVMAAVGKYAGNVSHEKLTMNVVTIF